MAIRAMSPSLRVMSVSFDSGLQSSKVSIFSLMPIEIASATFFVPPVGENVICLFISLVKNFIPKINNWAVCDLFCADLKILKKKREFIKPLLLKLLKSKKEYEIRFCFVILLEYFINEEFDFVIRELKKFNNEAYYAKMAAAWCLSYCFIKNYDKTLNIVKKGKFHPWVLSKGLTKSVESFRISKEQKEELKNLRARIK